jgi:hypothetical protein
MYRQHDAREDPRGWRQRPELARAMRRRGVQHDWGERDMCEATDVVDRQVAAYRDRDLERFLACYAAGWAHSRRHPAPVRRGGPSKGGTEGLGGV